MREFNLLYEFGDVSDGGELAERFLELFLEDTDGLDHTIESIENDVKAGSVAATIKTRARVTDEWFENSEEAVES